MRKKKMVKYIFVTLGFGTVLFLSYFAYILYTLAFWFGLEERVVGNYQPVIDGITSYQKKNNSLPTDIKDLMPEYIGSMPRLKEVKNYEYNIIEQGDWELIVIVEAKGKKKEFVYRTTQQLTVEEKKRLWTGCHKWFVLRIQN
ncbi:MAG: hypothetical protein H8D47_04805 [Planctomycetes bacterium]|nr:hypothetical protein [Planctomycetota bacterium]